MQAKLLFGLVALAYGVMALPARKLILPLLSRAVQYLQRYDDSLLNQNVTVPYTGRPFASASL